MSSNKFNIPILLPILENTPVIPNGYKSLYFKESGLFSKTANDEIKITFDESLSTIYVNQNGDDVSNGTYPTKPKKTINSAISYISSNRQSTSEVYTIKLSDGEYTENIELPENVRLEGKGSILNGTVVLNNGSVCELLNHLSTDNSQVLLTSNANTFSIYKVYTSDYNENDSITNVRNNNEGVLFIDLFNLRISPNGKGLLEDGGGSIHFNISNITLNGNNSRFTSAEVEGSNVIGSGDKVRTTGSYTNAWAIYVNEDSESNITIREINVSDKVYVVDNGGILYLNAQRTIGDTQGTATFNLIEELNDKLSKTSNVEFQGISTRLAIFKDNGGIEELELSEILTQSEEYVDNRFEVLADATHEPTGFQSLNDPYNKNIDVNFDSSTNICTLSGTFKAYYKGEVVLDIDNSTWDSPVLNNTVGIRSYTLRYNGTIWEWVEEPSPKDLIACYVYYRIDGTFVFGLRETRGMMQWQTRSKFRSTVGTTLISGGNLEDFTLNSTTAANRRPDVSVTVVEDEDLRTQIPTLTSKQYTRAWISSNNATSLIEQSDIVQTTANQPYYNQFTGGEWQLTLVPNNRFMSVWVYAKPSTSDTQSQYYNYVFLTGQGISDTISGERNRSVAGLQFADLLEIIPNIIFIGQIIISFSGNNWRLEEVAKLTGDRVTQVGQISGNYLTAVASNATLTGTGVPNDPLGVNINDAGTAVTELWSANKISSELTTKESILTFSTGLTRSVNTVTTNDSQINHNNLLNYDIAQHRVINDAIISTTALWSSNKINSEILAAVTDISKGDDGNINTSDGNGELQESNLKIHDYVSGESVIYNKSANFNNTGVEVNESTIYIRSQGEFAINTNTGNITITTDDGGIQLAGETVLLNTESPLLQNEFTPTLNNHIVNKLYVDSEITSFSNTLGSAAFVNTGTSVGNVPILDSGGKLSETVLPALAITEVFSVATDTARNNLTVQEGDVAIVDNSAEAGGESASYIYDGSEWKKLKSPDGLNTWSGSTNIVTVGNITTGTWNASTIAVNRGGTGRTTLTTGNILVGNGTGGINTIPNNSSNWDIAYMVRIEGLTGNGNGNLTLVRSGVANLVTDLSHTHPSSEITGLGTAATRNVGTDSNNVMEVGAFGLGSTQTILSSSDLLHELSVTQFYRHSTGGSPTDAPVAAQANGIHLQNTWGRSQIHLPNTGAEIGEMFFRTHNQPSGVMGGWRMVWHSSNLRSDSQNDSRYVQVAGDTMTGNLGLSISNPHYNLHSSSVIAIDTRNSSISDTEYSQILFKHDSSTSDVRWKGAIIFKREDSSGRGDFHFAINNSDVVQNVTYSDTIMSIKRDGNVGIGTSSPNRKLDVIGDAGVGTLQITSTGSAEHIALARNGNSYIIGNGGASSAINIVTGNRSLGLPNVRFNSDRTTTFYDNVGIGTDSPNRELDVEGDSRITGRVGIGADFWTGSRLLSQTNHSLGWAGYFRNTNSNGHSLMLRTAGTNSGNYVLRAGTETQPDILTVMGNQRVGIRTNSPSVELEVNGDVNVTGEVTAFYSSDIRLKENVKKLENSLSLIDKINPVSFTWKSDLKENERKQGITDYGVIAQELEEVFPDIVHDMYGGKYKGVDYIKLIPIMLSAIKEQNNIIKDLQKKINEKF